MLTLLAVSWQRSSRQCLWPLLFLHVLNDILTFLVSISTLAIPNEMLFWALVECVILPFFRMWARRFAIACGNGCRLWHGWPSNHSAESFGKQVFCLWRVTSQLTPIVLHAGGGRSPELPIPYSRIFIPIHQSISNSDNNHLLIEPVNRLWTFVLFRLRIFAFNDSSYFFLKKKKFNFGTSAARRSHRHIIARM